MVVCPSRRASSRRWLVCDAPRPPESRDTSSARRGHRAWKILMTLGTGAISQKSNLPSGSCADILHPCPRIRCGVCRECVMYRGVLTGLVLLALATAGVLLWPQSRTAVFSHVATSPHSRMETPAGAIPAVDLSAMSVPASHAGATVAGAHIRTTTQPLPLENGGRDCIFCAKDRL